VVCCNVNLRAVRIRSIQCVRFLVLNKLGLLRSYVEPGCIGKIINAEGTPDGESDFRQTIDAETRRHGKRTRVAYAIVHMCCSE